MKDIRELCAEFGLSRDFVYKCLRTIQLLQPHIHTGDKNKKLVDDEGVSIFTKIGELKTQGLSLPEIQKTLDAGLQTAPTTHLQPEATTSPTTPQTDLIRYYADELKAAQERLQDEQQQHFHELQERETTINDLTRKNDALTSTLRMLPASPEEVQAFYRDRDREKLHREFVEQQKREADTHKQRELQRITDALKACTWYEGKKRKVLLAELGALQNQT